jgi:hypothetical protein
MGVKWKRSDNRADEEQNEEERGDKWHEFKQEVFRVGFVLKLAVKV